MAKYDLVVFGATGFTGKLATRYVAEEYGNDISWAIAGRREEALHALAASEGQGHCDVIVADSTDFSSLQRMCAAAKVIASTAGPFSRYTAARPACLARVLSLYELIWAQFHTCINLESSLSGSSSRATGGGRGGGRARVCARERAPGTGQVHVR